MIKSRKFLAGLALFIAATAFVFTNHTDFDGWADMMKWVFGIYVGGNVGAHTAAKVKIGNGHHAPAAPQPTTPSPFVAVKTMSGKDPAEVSKQVEPVDPEGLEMPPPEKGTRI